MKHFFILLFVALIPLKGISQVKKILFVATNVDTVNEQANGTFLMEIAYPFQYFTDNGYEVDIVSPEGGSIPIYDKFDTTEALAKIIKSETFIKKTSSSLLPAQVDTKAYCAVFYPGGYGQFWDIYPHKEIAKITAKIYLSGGVIGAAGHGTASLVNVMLSPDNYLVEGKIMTCFPTWAEKEFMKDAAYGALLPFDMEQELVKRGAKLQYCTREDKGTHGVVDAENRLVTGAFADDAEFVAREMANLIARNFKAGGYKTK